jgi:UDP-N-acetylmuramate--alanine ligase
MGSTARLGKAQYRVADADESDRSFLKLSPILSVVTNIDREHMDCYRDMQDVEDTFVDFMNRVPFYGMVVACADDAPLRSLLARVKRRVVTYGTSQAADFRVQALASRPTPALNQFRVRYKDQDLGEFELHVPGQHNVLNATAAIAVGVGLDISRHHIREALQSFRGVDRRFQQKGTVRGVTVIDDYGHHPTEIRATLSAAKQAGFARVHVIFQPHRYSRTQLLMDDFAAAFADATTISVLDIYPASEPPIAGITGESLARRIRERGERSAQFAPSFADAVNTVAAQAREGDLILTLGAGNVSQLAPQVLDRLSATE